MVFIFDAMLYALCVFCLLAVAVYDFSKGSVKFIRGGSYPHCNSVLVDSRVRAVIDAASNPEKLMAFKNQARVDYLITSHAHEDHLVYNYLFPESAFYSHALDAPHFQDVKSLTDCYGDMPPETFQKWCDFFVRECHYVPRKVDRFLEDGMAMDFGGTSMEVIHTPGHTEGHCGFYFPQEKILFTADLDLTRVGPYYADRTSDIDKTIRSLERMKGIKAETYLTAHGKGIYEGDPAYIDRYMGIIFDREDRLIDFLRRGPKTLEGIIAEGIIYGKNPAFLGVWDLTLSERMMIAKHLDRLVEKGKLRKEEKLFILLD
jgi:glyoxylase-like metal-dependent hydrolase (beta-lactamase superfamily II)